MKDMKKYYLVLAIIIPVYIVIGFVSSRSDFFNTLNIVLAVIWVISLYAFRKSRDFERRKKK